jgi:hypothetical protein
MSGALAAQLRSRRAKPDRTYFDLANPGQGGRGRPGRAGPRDGRGQQLVAAGYGKATLPDGRVRCETCYPCRDLARPADCRHPVSRAEATYRTAWAADPQRLIDQARDADRMGVHSYAPIVSVAEHRGRGALVARLRQLG